MFTLYHAPQTRSVTIVSLLNLMGKLDDVEIKTVHIQRSDGKGLGTDPANPHPEGKVPVLDTGTTLLRERGAITLWLTDHYDHDLGRGPTHPKRAEYLKWLFYYQGVIEAVVAMSYMEMGEDPRVKAWVRGMEEMQTQIASALADHDFLVDDALSAADLLVASPFLWIPGLAGDNAVINAWLARVAEASDPAFDAEFDAISMEKLGLA